MAEVRKHRPRTTGSIGDQVRASISAGPRPVTPGEAAAPRYDPFVDQEAEHTSAAAAPAAFAVTAIDTAGWFSLGPDALQAMVQASRPNAESAAEQSPEQPGEDDD